MSMRIFVSHSAPDSQLGSRLVELLQALIGGAQVGSSSLPGHEPAGGEDSFAALKQQLAAADVVIGVVTGRALGSGEVPFQIGAAWALGKRLVLLLEPGGADVELYLPMGHAEALVLGPEALLELCASVGASAGVHTELNSAARQVLSQLFPDWQGQDRVSSERPIALVQQDSGATQKVWPVEGEAQADAAQAPEAGQAPSVEDNRPRAGLPTCSASLQAGRAVSDCVFNRDQGGPFADELDVPFGAFLAALGGSWSTLRELEDLDVWLEVADNLLGALVPAEQHVRCWYELGFALATLVNLAGRELGAGTAEDAELDGLWQAAWGAFSEAAREATVDDGTLEQLRSMLENLRGPQHGRDYANLGRVQECVRDLAGGCDAGGIAQSA